MSDYPMLISNKLHSFRNFRGQKYGTSRQSNESGAPFSEAPPYQSKYRSYSVTRSSHFTIPSITPIEMMQTEKNTVQATQIG